MQHENPAFVCINWLIIIILIFCFVLCALKWTEYGRNGVPEMGKQGYKH